MVDTLNKHMKPAFKTEVLIVGAGPTGLALACQFIRHGVDFVIVDKEATTTVYSKALGVHARTLEIYEQLGIADKAVADGVVAGKARILEGGSIRGEVDLSAVGKGLSQYPYMLVLEQSKNEKLLYKYLTEHGRDVRWRTSVESFQQNEDVVVATIKDEMGGTKMIEAKYLVGCDGARSPVRHQLGLKFEGSTFERIFFVADARVDWQLSHDALQVCLVKHSVVAFFPMPGENRYRIIGAFPEGYSKDEGEVLYEEIEEKIREEAGLDLQISEVNWFSTYKVHTRHVEAFRKGRCFVAGDAAHVHTPAGGQGMNTGIQDAYNLAWKLALVLRGRGGEKLLDSYNDERLENARNLVGSTDRMFNFLAGGDWFLNLVRTHLFPRLMGRALQIEKVRKEFFRRLSQIGITYRAHGLSQRSGDEQFCVKAGDRFPYFMIDGKSVYDRLHDPKFHLIMFDDGENEDAETSEQVQREYGDVLKHLVIPLYPAVAAIFGSRKSFSVLLRPDNYIGFIAKDSAADRLRTYMAGLAA